VDWAPTGFERARRETVRYHEELYAAAALGQAGTWLARPHRLLADALELVRSGRSVVAYDLGAGIGRHTIPLLRQLPDGSEVYAVDLLPSALRSLENAVPPGIRTRLHTRTALAFALTGLTPAGRHQPPPSPAESQAARKARLFSFIRDDAARGMSIRQLAARHRVHRRMVRQALADSAGPPPRKRGTRPAPAIGPAQDVLDKLAGEPLTVWEIWTTVTDQHDSDASYAAIRDYIRSRRKAGAVRSPETQLPSGRDLG
jgi:hypothetical protein